MVKFFLQTIILSLTLLFSQTATVLAANEPVRAELIAEESAIQPGRPFWVGVTLKMEEGWDTYWRNPGDSGLATQVIWTLPEGFKAGPLLWPYPQKIVSDSLVAFAYTDSVLLMAEITPTSEIAPGKKIEIVADVNWLACKESCVPGNAHLTMELPVMKQLPLPHPKTASLFVTAREFLPKKELALSVSSHADQFVVDLQGNTLGEIEEIVFMPHEGDVIDYLAPQNFQHKEGKISLNVKKARPDVAVDNLKGVLVVSGKGNTFKKAIEVDSAIQAPVRETDGVSSVAVALGFAFLGGLILNVMPCVLPVVALKIFGFVKMAGEKKSQIIKHGGVFALGVLISFWILSGALLVLRAYGAGVGWGFQLQEPLFVAILASLLFLLGLSLFGVFEMGTSLIALGGKNSSSSPLKSSFMSGVLATLVATPCTGPLLGPALGFAMTLPPISALAIFTSMGLGMASPYLLFSAFPKLLRFLPKPGNWMNIFKQIMGFLMMATVIWLLWVFGAQTDHLATMALMAAFLIMGVAAWIYGTWGAITKGKVTRFFASFIALSLIITSGGAALMAARHFSSEGSSTSVQLVSASGWQSYSPEKVAELRAQGTPVFIDFTAKWCLICQANKVVLHSSEMQKAFEEKGVVTMIADWTKRDPVITEELEKLGRTGVPVYVLYPADVSVKPLILPQTLTASVVTSYLDLLKTPTTTVYAP